MTDLFQIIEVIKSSNSPPFLCLFPLTEQKNMSGRKRTIEHGPSHSESGPSHSEPAHSEPAQVAPRRKKPKLDAQKESRRIRKQIKRNATRANKRNDCHPCPTCLVSGILIEQASSHSHLSSKLCSFHKKNKHEMAKEAFRMKLEMFTIKLGCRQACQILNLQQEIISTVKIICDITFERSLLANRHIIRCMEDGFVEDVFNKTFF